MTTWTDLVKKIYNNNKHKHGYKLKNAMKDAKKVYKKHSHTSKKHSHTSKKHTDTPYHVKGGEGCGAPPVNPYPLGGSTGGKKNKGSRRGNNRSIHRTKKCSWM